MKDGAGGMKNLECSTERPWGIHEFLRLDVACPRCGWSDADDRALPWEAPNGLPPFPDALAA